MTSLGRGGAAATVLAAVLAAATARCSDGEPGLAATGSGGAAAAVTATPDFDGAAALDHVRTQVEFGPRFTGSPGNRATVAWLEETLAGLGWATTRQSFTAGGTAAVNLIAHRGTGPAVALGAHFDTRIVADQDPDPAKRDRPSPGANDGGSGTAVLVELARVLDVAATGHTVCLLFFDAEDNGDLDGWDWALGSAHYVANRDVVPACSEPRAAVVADMVGDPEQLVEQERFSTDALVDALWAQADALGHGAVFPERVGYALIDDHRPFLAAGLPAAVVIDFDDAHWHTTHDDMDNVSAASLARVGGVLEVWLEAGAGF